MRLALAALLVSTVACNRAPRRPPITPATIPFELGRVTSVDERTLLAPVGSEVRWSDDGTAAVLVDGGIGRISVVAQRARGNNVNIRDIERLFARSLEKPTGPIMVEVTPGGMVLFCQESGSTRAGQPLRFAACVRIDDTTERAGILTMAVFGTVAEEFERLGGARLCAEVLRSARGFGPAREP